MLRRIQAAFSAKDFVAPLGRLVEFVACRKSYAYGHVEGAVFGGW